MDPQAVRRRRSRRLLSACWIGLLTAAGAAADPATPSLVDVLLDPSTGAIGGRRAMGVLAGRGGESGLEEIYPSAGFRVHMSLLEAPEVEHIFPVGEWFAPPPGRYRIWIAGDRLISATSSLVGYAGGPFEGRGFRAVLAVVEGGRVAPVVERAGKAGLEVRVLHAGPYVAERGVVGLEIVRRCPAAEVGPGLLMPAGTAIAGLWDPARNAYLALTRPFEVEAGGELEPVLRPVDEARAQLVVQLRRDRILAEQRELGLAAVATTLDGKLAADALVEAADIAYAFWYDLPPGTAEIVVEPALGAAVATEVDLVAGAIHRVVLEQEPTIDFGQPR